jgi:hypothetical protein
MSFTTPPQYKRVNLSFFEFYSINSNSLADVMFARLFFVVIILFFLKSYSNTEQNLLFTKRIPFVHNIPKRNVPTEV